MITKGAAMPYITLKGDIRRTIKCSIPVYDHFDRRSVLGHFDPIVTINLRPANVLYYHQDPE